MGHSAKTLHFPEPHQTLEYHTRRQSSQPLSSIMVRSRNPASNRDNSFEDKKHRRIRRTDILRDSKQPAPRLLDPGSKGLAYSETQITASGKTVSRSSAGRLYTVHRTNRGHSGDPGYRLAVESCYIMRRGCSRIRGFTGVVRRLHHQSTLRYGAAVHRHTETFPCLAESSGSGKYPGTRSRIDWKP